jgi:hypothetical protein
MELHMPIFYGEISMEFSCRVGKDIIDGGTDSRGKELWLSILHWGEPVLRNVAYATYMPH